MIRLTNAIGFGSGISGAAGVPAEYGYSSGGSLAATVATTDRCTFSTSVIAAHTDSDLPTATATSYAISDATEFGYQVAGNAGGLTDVGHRMTFSTGAWAAHTDANLSSARSGLVGLSDANTSGFGYFAAGEDASTDVVTGERLTFSTSVLTTHTDADLSTARRKCQGLGDATTFGYFIAGELGGVQDDTDRCTFSTSVVAAHTDSDLPTATTAGTTVGDSNTEGFGYYLAGVTGSRTVNGYRMTFSTGVLAAHTDANASIAVQGTAGMTDGGAFGFGYRLAGFDGDAPNNSTELSDRMTFSTSVLAAHTDANLSTARNGMVALADFAS